MERLREKRFENKYVAAWQSKVGPVAWQGPQTESVLKSLGERGFGKVVIVPIAFTSDHIETLYEIDVEYRKVAEESGITEFRRSRSLNDSEMFCRGLAEMVEDHLREKKVASAAYGLRCADCWQGEKCRKLLNPAF
ncbi:hypothetical protein MHBO_000932 [Bonamia ostreae]|uniref:Ferrochelatase n=1 Tax=Bonamia ostreae TaxID=126728 RepID=A0ABV2AHC0_9EUKA